MLGKLFNKKEAKSSAAVKKIPLDEVDGSGKKSAVDAEKIREKFEESRQEKSAEKQAEILAAREFFRKRNSLNSRIADDIRSSLRAKRIKFLYQGIFDVKTSKPAFYEVYTHLIDKSGWATEPGKYIPIANKSGLANWLDEVVFEMLMTAQKNVDTQFSINLTGHTLRRSMEFFEQLMHSISETGFPTHKLVFELKLAEIDKDGNTLGFIREAREMKFRFAIGYVGGGAKIIPMVKKLGFSIVKLDAIQFGEATRNEGLLRELKSIVKEARANNVELVMERIETKAMYELCQKIGIDYVQGYYLSMPAETLEPGMR